MLPMPKGEGFSVRPRRQPRESPKGLPGPSHGPGRVLVAIQDQPAVRADRGAYTQAFGYAHPTPATVLTGVLSRNRNPPMPQSPDAPIPRCPNPPMPSVSCFGFEDGPEVRPACVAAGLGEMAIPHHAGDLHLFAGEGVVVAKEVQRRLVVEVRALALHRLVRLGEQSNGLAAAMTPLLASGDAPLRLRALLLAASVVARIRHHLPIRRAEKDLQPYVNPRLPARRRQWLHRHLRTGEARVPAIRLPRDRDRLA